MKPIDDKFKTQLSVSHRLFTVFFFLYTRFFVLSFPLKLPICPVIATRSQPNLSTDIFPLIQIKEKFGTQEHLHPICKIEDSEKKKKKMGLKSSNAVCDLCGLVDVREIDGCRFETLIYLFLVFGATKSWFLGKLGTIVIKRKKIEDIWFSFSESKILRFQFL